jgi:hypothetical protein
MADLAKRYAERCGYHVSIEDINDINASRTTLLKPDLVAKYLTKEWSVWMDADAMMLRPIDELFAVDFDVAIPTQQVRPSGGRYGRYLNASFIAARNTEPAKQFLTHWSANQNTPDDQYNLNDILGSYLDDDIFGKHGEVLDCDGVKLLLLDPDVYAHTASLYEQEWPTPEHVRVIHFIGRLQRDAWRDYRRLMEAPCS